MPKITSRLTDKAILRELGTRLTRRRLELGLTQATVAEHAGISKRTLERIEGGASAQLATVLPILRVLELVGGLDALVPAAVASPIEIARLRRKPRPRDASGLPGGEGP